MTTNREKLAKMTNEELAKYLGCICCVHQAPNSFCFDESKDCIKGVLQWLNQESEE